MSEAITVYAVNHGEYSRWTIDGIFSTREKAEEFMAKCKASEESYIKYFNGIMEYELDAELAQTEYTEYRCSIRVIDGSVVTDDCHSFQEFGIPQSSSAVDIGLAIGRSHKSAEHAMKLAVEARQKWLRENAK